MNTKRLLGALCIALAGASAITGCADMSQRDRNTAIGAGIGAVAGSALGGGAAGTIGGAAVGGVIGNNVRTTR